MDINKLIEELEKLKNNGSKEVLIYNNNSYTISKIIEIDTTEDKQIIWLNTND